MELLRCSSMLERILSFDFGCSPFGRFGFQDFVALSILKVASVAALLRFCSNDRS